MVSEEVKATYEAVIGLEVHAQMLTKTKAYSSDAIEYAIKLGLALNCEIAENQHFDRKNYYYPDLPKGYQITQDKTPICANGKIDLQMEDGTTKYVGITRIHMEEDTGKSIHDVDVYDTLVD